MWVAFYNYFEGELVKQGMVWLNPDQVSSLQALDRPDEATNYSVYLANGGKYRLDETDFQALSYKLGQLFN